MTILPEQILERTLAKPFLAGIVFPTSDAWWTAAPAARDLALELHADQTRFHSTLPYAYHLGETALFMSLAHQFDSSWTLADGIAAAWLHDAMEDQGLDLSRVHTLFGSSVAVSVASVSKNPLLSGPAAMLDSLDRIQAAGALACALKLCDRSSNVSEEAPSSWSLSKRHSYLDEADLIVQRLGDQASPRLSSLLTGIVDKHRSSLPRSFGPR